MEKGKHTETKWSGSSHRSMQDYHLLFGLVNPKAKTLTTFRVNPLSVFDNVFAVNKFLAMLISTHISIHLLSALASRYCPSAGCTPLLSQGVKKPQLTITEA